jgi:predicted RNA binding protein YcfA (HicA-like mRNA interferase family)
MKLPRDLTGAELIQRLERLGYQVTRQTGSHIRLTCGTPQVHHITVPKHDPLKVGTLAAILAEVATHHRLPRDELLQRLFL